MGNQETVAQSREHLLDAGYSHPAKPEDRLTELVACVLDILRAARLRAVQRVRLDPM